MSETPAAGDAHRRPRAGVVPRAGALLRAVLIIALYFAVFAYPTTRLLIWLAPAWSSQALVLAMIFAAPAALYLLAQRVGARVRRAVLRLVFFWLGACFLLLFLVLAGELALAVAPLDSPAVGAGVLAAFAALTLAGVVNAERLHLRRLEVASDKLAAPLRLVQISDVHLGSRAPGFLRRIVARVDALAPDVVVVTGDLVDMHGITEQELAPLAALSVPVFFCIGNHERYIDCEAICAHLTALGVTVLRDAASAHGPLQIIGIDDRPARDTVADRLSRLALDPARFRVLLYHRPHGLEDAAARGIDLMLCGHTHNGQIVPFNWAVKRQFPRICGRYEHAGTTLYVSPGTGTWGPLLRLGSRNEITEIVLVPR